MSSAIDAPAFLTNPYLQTTLTPIPELNREDYPCVTWWTRYEWTHRPERGKTRAVTEPAQDSEDLTNDLDDSMMDADESKPERGQGRSLPGKNVTLTFIQLEDGVEITGHRGVEMRGFARSLWVLMAEAKPMPSKWSMLDAARQSRYQYDMRTKYPELGYCYNNWKADYIAMIAYPSWYSHRDKKVKLEEEANAMVLDNARNKRPHLDPPNHKAKRVKTSPVPSHLAPVVGCADETRLTLIEDDIEVDDVGADREVGIRTRSKPSLANRTPRILSSNPVNQHIPPRRRRRKRR